MYILCFIQTVSDFSGPGAGFSGCKQSLFVHPLDMIKILSKVRKIISSICFSANMPVRLYPLMM